MQITNQLRSEAFVKSKEAVLLLDVAEVLKHGRQGQGRFPEKGLRVSRSDRLVPNLNEDLGIFDWVCQGGQAGSERETRPLVLDDRVVGVGGRRRNDGSVVSHGEANIRQATQWKV